MKPLLISLLAISVSPEALACGGSDYRFLDQPLVPATRHVNDWLYAFDGYETSPAPLTRFLYGVEATDPVVYRPLWKAAYDRWGTEPEVAPPPAPSAAAFDAAVARGDRAAAHQAAVELVEAILDLPAVLAEDHAELLRRPVEYLEIEGSIAQVPAPAVAAYFQTGAAAPGTPLARAAEVRGLDPAQAAERLGRDAKHPRAASLRWLDLRHRAQVGLANGWSAEEVRQATSPAVFDDLQSRADAWLRDFPQHPLADYVRLFKVRHHYLRGEGDRAWAILLDLYARHPARAAAEMRYLTQQGLPPPKLELTSLPPELASALISEVTVSSADWDAMWKKSQASPAAPWALPLQERLLWDLVEDPPANGKLPSMFPAVAAAPTPAWARLRLGVLTQTGATEAAWAQLDAMRGDDAYAAPFRAQILLTQGKWREALLTPGLDPDARAYLMRVLAPDTAIEALIDDATLGKDARLELALRRRLGPGGWAAGIALLKPSDPERALLWQQAQALDTRRRPQDRLIYARFMRAQAGRIFLDRGYEEVVFYRSLPMRTWGDGPARAAGLPFSEAQEAEAIRAWATRSFATWEALQAYAEWLGALDVARLKGADLTEARRVLDEADTAYNALLNYGSYDSYAWGTFLPDSEPAKTVRRVGRALRQRIP